MSEDFDREAEKERLREKLEDDQESRKATEHMSDLLLKGATMTNHHCDACGDPIFRYDGQEFCPTCGETVEDDEEASAGQEGTEADDEATADDGGQGANDAEAATPEASAGEATSETTAGTTPPGPAGDPPEEHGTADSGPSSGRHEESSSGRREASLDESGRSTGGSGRSPGSTTSRTPPASAPAERSAGRSPDAAASEQPRAGNLGEARTSLVWTLSDLAARAEAAEDVRRTRDLLAAAREAAEALAALDRVER